ncbi:hypothetical protein [Burkholderia ubonensis]|uniref:Uncharacterized protein n=1 Tax=Burkholderia ubonensis TaxID=101571 RepID=A0AA40R451_9BURK|nr:hypothetical protein [Burkholderia ubonensis]KVC86463.1 hypothetical protein WI74_29910 [Burkholderia ubonensis]KVC97574.1 hypothetical protein WI79_24405 [Burkholderia ubonensis]KVD22794.1 hypothetical protein WI81_03485 [Burkholderia ubonensis]KVD31530.1 hypothetical protein WI82_09505 [Burkholderia ubonensis]KVD51947.1 hypothetical protein WI87_27205 [Burkholderia ubonensis]
MEHLVRIVNDTDRQVLAWLRTQVGDARVERAARQLGHTRKPFPSALCRYLGVSAPATLRHTARPRAVRDFSVGDRYLSLIRQHLAAHTAGR